MDRLERWLRVIAQKGARCCRDHSRRRGRHPAAPADETANADDAPADVVSKKRRRAPAKAKASGAKTPAKKPRAPAKKAAAKDKKAATTGKKAAATGKKTRRTTGK
ncbi:uncharacterized protein KRP23_9709 [Phytophthora ramorum]|uniref:uncharacterized protein n=1 Tax=Phytophthora ramorum TaxID=164328 RepID=UPI00309E6613|nr:hypothetical protein KRP23_9709 [Phytophthora ramorum]